MIVTHSRRHDGRVQENRGSGVIIGHFFLTAYHNLKPLPVGNFVTTNSYLGGIAIEPEVIDSNADIAIIRVPAALCPSWCTSSDLLPAAEADLAATVRWFRSPATAADGTPGWQQARVTSRTWSLPGSQLQRPSNDCDAGLVLEVDQPFLPGSSGAGVWDANNRLVGIAQGSYQTRDGHLTGYFKPLRCIREHWPTLSSSEP